MTNALQIWTFLMTCYWTTISENSKMNALGNYRFNFKLAPTHIIGKKNTPKQREITTTLLLCPKPRDKIFLRHWMPTILKAKKTCPKKIKCTNDLHKWTDKQKDMELNGISREKLLLVVLGFITNCKSHLLGLNRHCDISEHLHDTCYHGADIPWPFQVLRTERKQGSPYSIVDCKVSGRS